MKTLTVEEVVLTKRETLQLEVLTGDVDLKRVIRAPVVSNPGLILAGYTERTPGGRIQVLGETEMSYLNALPAAELRRVLETFFSLDMPVAFVTKRLAVPDLMLELARTHGVPVVRSGVKTGDFFRRIQPYLEEQFAPSTTVHGSLADVYGIGLLFTGRSGIGKSECVLDLVERGHRLVADDVVYVTRRGNDVLIGRGHELQRHHMMSIRPDSSNSSLSLLI